MKASGKYWAARRLDAIAGAIWLAAWLVPGPQARAGSWTWSGAGGDGNWNTGANWGGTPPTSALDTDLSFGGSAGLANTNNIANPFVLRRLTFNSGAGAFVLGGDPLEVCGNISNGSASVETIGNAIALVSNSTWSAANGNLVFSGNISGTGALTRTGTKNVTLTGTNAIAFATRGITGGGTLTIAGGVTTNLTQYDILGNNSKNTLIVTNGGRFVTPVNVNINSGGTGNSNSVLVCGAGSVWDGAAAAPTLALRTDVRFVVTENGMVTNIGEFTLGASDQRVSVEVSKGGCISASSGKSVGYNNRLWIGGTNAAGEPARVTINGGMAVGETYTSSSNNVTVDAGGILVSGGIGLGYGYNGTGVHNSLILTNGGQFICGGGAWGTRIGNAGSANNWAWIGGSNPVTGVRSMWTLQGANLWLGYPGSAEVNTNHTLIIADGGIVSNATVILGDMAYGTGGAYRAKLIITNGGSLFGTLTVGERGSSNTAVVVGNNTRLNGLGSTLTVGSTLNARCNVLRVDDGAVVENIGAVQVGYISGFPGYQASANSVIVTNGGRVTSSAASYIGHTNYGTNEWATNNMVIVAGSNSVWDAGNQSVVVGAAEWTGSYTVGNELRVMPDGTITNIDVLTVGYTVSGAISVSNSVLLYGGNISVGTVNVSPSNAVNLYGGSLSATTLTMQNESQIGVDMENPGDFLVQGDATLNGYVYPINFPTMGGESASCTVVRCTGSLLGSGLAVAPLPPRYKATLATNTASSPKEVVLRVVAPSTGTVLVFR